MPRVDEREGHRKVEDGKIKKTRPGADSEWGREVKNHCHKRY